jgi:hypothetical protein
VTEPTSQLRVEQAAKALCNDEVLDALVKHRELHAVGSGILVEVEANSEWLVQSGSSALAGHSERARGASATVRVALAEPEFGSKWRALRSE